MYKIEKTGTNRLDIELGGQLDDTEMKGLIGELLSLGEECSNGAVVCRCKDVHFPTLGAVMVELSHFPKIMRLAHKFDRCAVIAEQEWVNMAASVEAWLLPGIKVKAFSHEQEADAVAWAEGKS